MSDKRRARRAKQVRRDARRAKNRVAESSTDTAVRDAIRQALARGHPLDLLVLASAIIQTTKPDPFAYLKSRQWDTLRLEDLVAGLVGAQIPETTALLAVLAELLVDDPMQQLRCRREVADRRDHLPGWITALPRVEVYRAVRRTDAFGDCDELVVGMRLADRHELTIAVQIDHNLWSGVADAGVEADPIDEALARLAEYSIDTDVFEMSLADARVWIEDALNKPPVAPETEAWPACRALVKWLVGRLPEGGEHRSAVGEWEADEELCDRFFTTSAATPFTDSSHRELLLELFDTGTGDPLRWSAARVERVIGGKLLGMDRFPLEVALDAPDLLRAFIPYAHEQSGIRDELTSETLAMVDALRSSYKREVLRQAKFWDLDDAI